MIVPMLALPPATPFTSQVTAVLVVDVVVVLARFTVAVKSVWAPGATVAADGEIVTELTVVAPEPPPQPDRISAAEKTAKNKKRRKWGIFRFGQPNGGAALAH